MGCGALCLLAVGLPVSAQTTYPNRAIRMVAPFAPGGATDVVARMASREVQGERLSQITTSFTRQRWR